MGSQRRGSRDMTEKEKEHEYVLHQKRSYGETIVGEGSEEMEKLGAAGETRERREQALEGRHRGLDAMSRHKEPR